MLTVDELKDIHLAIIHRENRLIDTVLPLMESAEYEKYKAEADRLHALRQKVCQMSLEAELGFSLS